MSFVCSVCGEEHDDMPALTFSSPHYYHILSDGDKAVMATLTEDGCIIEHETQTDRFIRVGLRLPIIDSEETLEYGVWVSLSEKSFEYYMDNFGEDIEGTTFFGYLCNQIPGYEQTLSIKANVVCGPKGLRSQIFLHDDQQDNLLVVDSIHGITQEEADKRIHLLM